MQVFALDVLPACGAAYDGSNIMTMRGNRINRCKATLNKVVEFEEIAGRITTHGQFGKYHDVGSGLTGFGKGSYDLRGIRLEVPYVVVDLGKRYFHALKLKNNPDFQCKIICQRLVVDGRILRIPAIQDVHETIIEGNTCEEAGAPSQVEIRPCPYYQ
jgi:hypothetical protein